MSGTTFAERLAATNLSGRDVRWCLLIQGVPHVFQSDAVDAPAAVVALAGFGADEDGTGNPRPRVKGLMVPDIASKRIDMEQRGMVCGNSRFTVVDDFDETLRALFAPNTRRATFIADDVGAAPSVVPVNNCDVFAAGDVIYVGAETMVVDSLDNTATPDEVTTAIRGAFGSKAVPHFGTTDEGEGVFLVPPVWAGRRAKLVMYFVDEDGDSTADLATVIDTFALDTTPVPVGSNAWEIKATHLCTEIRQKKLGTGLRECKPATAVVREPETDTTFRHSVGEENVDLFVSGALRTWVMIKGNASRTVSIPGADGFRVRQRIDGAEGVSIVPFVQALSSGSIEVGDDNRVVGSIDVALPASFKHIAVLEGFFPGVLAVIALTSRTGNGGNGTYDKLPGRDRAAFTEAAWRFGAGIDEDEVDVAAFVLAAAELRPWDYVIDREIPVSDLMRDFCLPTDTFWLNKNDGTLSVKPLSEERTDSVATISKSDLVIGNDPLVTYDEEAIYPRLTMQMGYDPVSEAFEATINLIDNDLAARYPTRDDRLELECRSLTLENPATGEGTMRRSVSTEADLEQMLRRFQKGNGRGRVLVKLRCRFSLVTLELGDVVTIGSDLDATDFAGATIAGRIGRVVELAPDFKDMVLVVTVELLEQLFHIAPAAVVASRAGAVLTLRQNGAELADGHATTPADMFADGWVVDYHDVSGDVVHQATILSHTSTTATLSSAPAWANENNVDFITVSPQDDIAGEAANADGFTPRDFIYQMPDDAHADVDVVFETRWR